MSSGDVLISHDSISRFLWDERERILRRADGFVELRDFYVAFTGDLDVGRVDTDTPLTRYALVVATYALCVWRSRDDARSQKERADSSLDLAIFRISSAKKDAPPGLAKRAPSVGKLSYSTKGLSVAAREASPLSVAGMKTIGELFAALPVQKDPRARSEWRQFIDFADWVVAPRSEAAREALSVAYSEMAHEASDQETRDYCLITGTSYARRVPPAPPVCVRSA
jgi:hypothetical protein